jgi:pyrimidine 5'-nucleotidase
MEKQHPFTHRTISPAKRRRGELPVSVVFLDCDDCLYQNSWQTMRKITDKIAKYTERLGVDSAKAFELYKTHGTCLKGLLAEGFLTEAGSEEYLTTVHEIDLSDIKPDPALRDCLARLSKPTWIFTASAKEHAERCVERIGLGDLDWRGIIDTRNCGFETKHSAASFRVAMQTAGVADPSACVFCDDSVKNITAAAAVGWRTVLVGKVDPVSGEAVKCDAADFHIASLHELPTVLPEIFDNERSLSPAPPRFL